jgi:hypothetical protein
MNHPYQNALTPRYSRELIVARHHQGRESGENPMAA